MSREWDRRFMQVALEFASWSKDPDTKVGAVFVRDRRIVVQGYNGMPRGVQDLPTRMVRDGGEKYHWMEHAERAAIYDAANRGVSIRGCDLYVTLQPCADCVRGLIAVGTRRIVYLTRRPDERGEVMLAEAGVGLLQFTE